MIENQSLYYYYNEYINGNKSVLNKLFVIRKNKTKEDGSLRFTVTDLNKMVSAAYSAYQQQGIISNGRYRKTIEGIFKGTIEDMTDIFIEELINIFSDHENTIKSEKDLYSKLKYNIVIKINNILEKDNSQYEQPVEYEKGHFQNKSNINPSDHDRFSEYSYKKYAQGSGHRSYSCFYRYLLKIMHSYDIIQMLPANNVVAKNIIKLILSEESTGKYSIDKNTVCIDSSKNITDLYKSVYGDSITIEQVSEAYGIIYDLFMHCFYGYVPDRRNKYIKKSKTEVKREPLKSETLSTFSVQEKVISDKKPVLKSEYIKIMDQKLGRCIAS